MARLIGFVLPYLLASCYAVQHVQDPIGAVQGVIGRLLGADYITAFQLSVIPADYQSGNDVFELDANATTVVVRGNSGVSLAAGVHWYLKYYCNASISWGKEATGNQLSSVPPPAQLPLPAAERRVSPVQYRYAYNVCTFGYTMPWWSFDRTPGATKLADASPPELAAAAASLPVGTSITWREELDRLALWGINLPLAFAGQEIVFRQTFEEFNLTDYDYSGDFLSGPAFLPWQRMGNIQRLDNPRDGLLQSWMTQQAALQLLILQEARALGMAPVLAGFAGHVPQAITRVYPGARVNQSAQWNGFNATYADTLLLDPTDPLFAAIGKRYYENLVATFGLNPSPLPNFYNADTFNEQAPSSSDPAYLQAVNAAIYGAMTAAGVPQPVFVLQGWLFLESFWTNDRIAAYLSGVPDSGMLILDLFTDSQPIWSRPGLNSYFGKPFIWNMLAVFGGRRGIYGNLTRIAAQPLIDLATPGSTMVGLGFTPEATEMLPVVFDLLFDVGWRAAPPSVPDWLSQWVVRRYGVNSPSLQQAWAVLRDGPLNIYYDYGTTEGFCRLEQPPQLTVPTDRTGPSPDAFVAALRLFVAAGVHGEVPDPTLSTYTYDLIDVTRQALCAIFTDLANLAGAAYLYGAAAGVNVTGPLAAMTSRHASLLADLDVLLASDANYLMGHWVADARAWGAAAGNASWADDLEEEARNQVTVWGVVGSQVSDYAAKNGWSGLVSRYYGSRWDLHTQYVMGAAASGKPVNWTAYGNDLAALEASWLQDRTPFPATPSGDALAAASAALAAYATGVASAYDVLPNTDAPAQPGVQPVDIYQSVHMDVGVLMALCDADALCAGFNSNGYMKNSTGTRAASTGTTLYVKRAPAVTVM